MKARDVERGDVVRTPAGDDFRVRQVIGPIELAGDWCMVFVPMTDRLIETVKGCSERLPIFEVDFPLRVNGID